MFQFEIPLMYTENFNQVAWLRSMGMHPSIAFVSEHDIIDCLVVLMDNFPLGVAEYFERHALDNVANLNCRILPFSITL